MRGLRLPSCVLLCLFLTTPLMTWAGNCPEGQKLNDRQGDCQPIPGWKAEKVEKLVVVNAEDYKTISANDIKNIKFPSSDAILNCGFAYFEAEGWLAGMGPIKLDQFGVKAVNADWYYNFDFGTRGANGERLRKNVAKNNSRIKSCIFRDGSGWIFDLPMTSSYNPIYWHVQAIHIGHKGWNSLGNMYVREKSKFPVRVGDIKELNFDVDYKYDLVEGMVNIHLALWFVDEAKDDPNKVGDDPFLEVMIKLKNQDPNDCRTTVGSFRVIGETWRYCFKNSGWSQGTNDSSIKKFASMNIQFPNNRSNLNGAHTFNLKLKDLIVGLKKKGYIKDDQKLLGLEFNNELKYGRGVMDITHMDYKLVKH